MGVVVVVGFRVVGVASGSDISDRFPYPFEMGRGVGSDGRFTLLSKAELAIIAGLSLDVDFGVSDPVTISIGGPW